MFKTHGKKKTTRSPGGLVKKTFWFHADEAQRLRREAYEQETTQAAIVREAVRQFFQMPDPADGVSGENLAEDVAEDLEADPGLREQVSGLLDDYSTDPAQAAEILRGIKARDDE